MNITIDPSRRIVHDSCPRWAACTYCTWRHSLLTVHPCTIRFSTVRHRFVMSLFASVNRNPAWRPPAFVDATIFIAQPNNSFRCMEAHLR
ncbi:unnamed protein product [Chondrus crispus]|uniref:Uncharacterized protein n=1 Tax=Chondrus crispus TaxID=2769 RepID=R7QM98_CHOCR|nr:unnamed protein product [Chondrus crispus]CDF39224.1 unnamed protein product [Chondrus crispus]|eukprot:XP_005719135.1 unnamed protein product [Chondrus crispus]